MWCEMMPFMMVMLGWWGEVDVVVGVNVGVIC